MKALIVGYGKMGKELVTHAPAHHIAIVGLIVRDTGGAIVDQPPPGCQLFSCLTEYALAPCDLVFDFSSPEGILDRIALACSLKKPILVGTTGWEHLFGEAKKIVEKTYGTLLYSPNFSLAVALYLSLVKKAAELLTAIPGSDAGIVEIHHDQKKDAPSGTAKKMVSIVAEPFPAIKNTPQHVASLRLGGLAGTHQLIIDAPCDTISLEHHSKGRGSFAQGALAAANWLLDKKEHGGWYGFEDFLRDRLPGYDL